MNKKTKLIRERHLKKFSQLSPEKQLCWALTHGYFLYSLLSRKEKEWTNQLRNGGKKIRTPAKFSALRIKGAKVK